MTTARPIQIHTLLHGAGTHARIVGRPAVKSMTFAEDFDDIATRIGWKHTPVKAGIFKHRIEPPPISFAQMADPTGIFSNNVSYLALGDVPVALSFALRQPISVPTFEGDRIVETELAHNTSTYLGEQNLTARMCSSELYSHVKRRIPILLRIYHVCRMALVVSAKFPSAIPQLEIEHALYWCLSILACIVLPVLTRDHTASHIETYRVHAFNRIRIQRQADVSRLLDRALNLTDLVTTELYPSDAAPEIVHWIRDVGLDNQCTVFEPRLRNLECVPEMSEIRDWLTRIPLDRRAFPSFLYVVQTLAAILFDDPTVIFTRIQAWRASTTPSTTLGYDLHARSAYAITRVSYVHRKHLMPVYLWLTDMSWLARRCDKDDEKQAHVAPHKNYMISLESELYQIALSAFHTLLTRVNITDEKRALIASVVNDELEIPVILEPDASNAMHQKPTNEFLLLSMHQLRFTVYVWLRLSIVMTTLYGVPYSNKAKVIANAMMMVFPQDLSFFAIWCIIHRAFVTRKLVTEASKSEGWRPLHDDEDKLWVTHTLVVLCCETLDALLKERYLRAEVKWRGVASIDPRVLTNETHYYIMLAANFCGRLLERAEGRASHHPLFLDALVRVSQLSHLCCKYDMIGRAGRFLVEAAEAVTGSVSSGGGSGFGAWPVSSDAGNSSSSSSSSSSETRAVVAVAGVPVEDVHHETMRLRYAFVSEILLGDRAFHHSQSQTQVVYHAYTVDSLSASFRLCYVKSLLLQHDYALASRYLTGLADFWKEPTLDLEYERAAAQCTISYLNEVCDHGAAVAMARSITSSVSEVTLKTMETCKRRLLDILHVRIQTGMHIVLAELRDFTMLLYSAQRPTDAEKAPVSHRTDRAVVDLNTLPRVDDSGRVIPGRVPVKVREEEVLLLQSIAKPTMTSARPAIKKMTMTLPSEQKQQQQPKSGDSNTSGKRKSPSPVTDAAPVIITHSKKQKPWLFLLTAPSLGTIHQFGTKPGRLTVKSVPNGSL